ncbi:substance-P receptor-like [Antedon mediterranea]|uniref:substance-P receptor-like n=1 Tax=Antedon mediterranea TaxID=105859 RepID=UPI003AF638E8
MENGTDYINATAESDEYGIDLAFILCWCVSGAVGVIGNLIMSLTILLNRDLRNVTNILIVNAAVGDIAFILIMLPLNIYTWVTWVWPFGDFLCKLTNMVTMYSMTTSAYSFCAISYDRYMVVTKPLEHRSIRTRRVSCYIITIDFIGLLSVIPTYFMAYEEDNQCNYLDHGTTMAQIHEVTVFICLYVIPLFVIGFNYIRIAKVLVLSIRRQLCERSNAAIAKQQSKRIRLTKSLLLIIIIYGLCMLPYYIANIGLQFLTDEIALQRFYNIIMIPSVLCYVLATLVNPVMMFVLSQKYRHHVLRCRPTFFRPNLMNTRANGSNRLTLTRRTTGTQF